MRRAWFLAAGLLAAAVPAAAPAAITVSGAGVGPVKFASMRCTLTKKGFVARGLVEGAVLHIYVQPWTGNRIYEVEYGDEAFNPTGGDGTGFKFAAPGGGVYSNGWEPATDVDRLTVGGSIRTAAKPRKQVSLNFPIAYDESMGPDFVTILGTATCAKPKK